MLAAFMTGRPVAGSTHPGKYDVSIMANMCKHLKYIPLFPTLSSYFHLRNQQIVKLGFQARQFDPSSWHSVMTL